MRTDRLPFYLLVRRGIRFVCVVSPGGFYGLPYGAKQSHESTLAAVFRVALEIFGSTPLDYERIGEIHGRAVYRVLIRSLPVSDRLKLLTLAELGRKPLCSDYAHALGKLLEKGSVFY